MLGQAFTFLLAMLVAAIYVLLVVSSLDNVKEEDNIIDVASYFLGTVLTLTFLGLLMVLEDYQNNFSKEDCHASDTGRPAEAGEAR